jgi:hypothetical protein
MRISRANDIVGEWTAGQVIKRIADGSLLPSDFYYDEDSSEWLPLSGLAARLATPKPVKATGRPCYCGTGLPFNICHGDGDQY